MAPRLRRSAPGLVAGALALLALWLAPSSWREIARERGFDRMLALVSPGGAPSPGERVVFVDIDAASLDAFGPWPWRRAALAALIERIAQDKPAAIALDMLLSGEDARSPAGLARRLAAETGRPEIAALVKELDDDDAALARALSAAPIALGWALDPGGEAPSRLIPVLARDGARIGVPWEDAGQSGPPPALAQAAAGFGALSLPGDADGATRRVPLLVAVGDQIQPGLAAEALRLARGASGYLLSDQAPTLSIGAQRVALGPTAMLRLVPGAAPIERIGAAAVLATAQAQDFAGAIVVIGGSAPQMGALRPGPDDPLTPSGLIHAMAIRQIAAGAAPLRPAAAPIIEAAMALAAVAAAAGLALPLAGVALLASPVAALAAAWSGVLLDPGPALLAGAVALLASSIAEYRARNRREARLRRRFEQHLAPAVVERIVADPSSLKLKGERREITALFTDVEGFTTTTRAVPAEQLVRVLDSYFEGVARIIVEHGGTIDKYVGDAAHAFFNAPFDLPDHPGKALACARALRDWTAGHRESGEAGAIGFGRTRIGLETGPAVVGEVGVGSKLDYTAYGDVMNLAARLEAMNKTLGSTIAVGPVASRRCGEALASRGEQEIRGFGWLEVFVPPEDAAAPDKKAPEPDGAGA